MSDARGATALTVLLVALVTGVVGLLLVTAAADVAASAVRARTAAESAALAAVGTNTLAGGTGDPVAAAQEAAVANGAVLVDCCGSVPLEANTVAAVEPGTRVVRTFLPLVRSRARAGLRPPEEAAPGQGTGLLVRPVHGPVTSGFGWRVHPISGVRRFHAGIDFGAPTGTTVRAAAPGVVRSAGWRGGYGLAVVVDHGGGLTTLYAHLSSITVREGAPVAAGQGIGAVGSTGASTGPHLHFEVRVNGVPRDPLGYL